MKLEKIKPQSGRMIGKEGRMVDLEEVVDTVSHQLKQRKDKPISFAKKATICEMPEDGYRLRLLSKDGSVYASKGGTLQKSSDWGVTWEVLIIPSQIFEGKINSVLKLDNGELFIAVQDTAQGGTGMKIYRTDHQENGVVQVHAFGAGQGFVYDEFGFTHFGDMIFASTYGAAPEVTEVVAWMSPDKGRTWNKIFSMPNIEQPNGKHHHLHDVRYDPYTNVVWVCAGDSVSYPHTNNFVHTNSFVYWSNDFGKTWTKAFGYRSTQVIPLPESTLFLSDEPERIGAVRYDHSYLGVDGENLEWDGIKNTPESWIAQRMPGQYDGFTWGTNAAIEYGENARAFFGFRNTPVNGLNYAPPTVWGTNDGVRFNAVWTLGRITTARNGINEQGILGVFGPDKDNNLAVSLSADVGNGREFQLLKLEL